MMATQSNSTVQMSVRSYRDLVAWQRAVALGLHVYRLTPDFPEFERFALTQQLHRAALSVPSNIAEGYGRGATKEYLRFLKIARGSLCELETQILFARELGYVAPDQYSETQALVDDCQRVLFGLIRSIKRS